MDRREHVAALAVLTMIGVALLALTPSGQVLPLLLGSLLLLVTPFLAGLWLRSWWTILLMPLANLVAASVAILVDLVAYRAGGVRAFPGYVRDFRDPRMGILQFLAVLVVGLMALSAAIGTLSGKYSVRGDGRERGGTA